MAFVFFWLMVSGSDRQTLRLCISKTLRPMGTDFHVLMLFHG